MLGAADYMQILKSVTVFLDGYIYNLKRFKTEIIAELNQKLKSEPEGMRVKQLISARMCEYIYLLQQAVKLVLNGIIQKNLGKKMAKTFFEEKPDDFVSRSNFSGSVAEANEVTAKISLMKT